MGRTANFLKNATDLVPEDGRDVLRSVGITHIETLKNAYQMEFVPGVPLYQFVNDGGVLKQSEIDLAVSNLEKAHELLLAEMGQYARPHGDLVNPGATMPGLNNLHVDNIKINPLSGGGNQILFVDYGGFGPKDPSMMQVASDMQKEIEGVRTALNNLYSPQAIEQRSIDMQWDDRF